MDSLFNFHTGIKNVDLKEEEDREMMQMVGRVVRKSEEEISQEETQANSFPKNDENSPKTDENSPKTITQRRKSLEEIYEDYWQGFGC